MDGVSVCGRRRMQQPDELKEERRREKLLNNVNGEIRIYWMIKKEAHNWTRCRRNLTDQVQGSARRQNN